MQELQIGRVYRHFKGDVAAHSGKIEYRAIMPNAETQSRTWSHSGFALRFCVEGKETEPL